MKLVWHLIRHNLASLRPLVLAWLAVLVVQSVVLRMGPPVPDGMVGPPMSLDIAVLVMRLALTVVFVAALVLNHPVVGTSAFWLTRPVPRADLFVGTVATLAIVTVAVPFVWGLATFWWLGFDAVHAAAAALRLAIEQALFALMALLLAALTRNLAQAIVAALAIMALFFAGRSALQVLPYRPLEFGLVMRQTEWTAAWSAAAACVLLLALAAHHYLTLKARRSLVLVTAVIVLAVLNSRFPLVRWASGRDIPLAPLSIDLPLLTFDRTSIRTGNVSRISASGTRVSMSQSALVEDAGPPGALILKPLAVQSRIRFPDGLAENFDSGQVTPWVDGSPDTKPSPQPWASMARALGVTAVAPPADAAGDRFRITFLEVSPATFAARSSETSTLLMNVTSEAYQYDVFVRMLLTPGARASGPACVVEFEGTAPADEGVSVLVRTFKLPDTGVPAATYYALVNRARQQAVVSARLTSERFRTALGYDATPIVTRDLVTFDGRAQVGLSPEWLAEAEFVVLRPRSIGRVIRGARETGFTLAPPHVAAPETPNSREDQP